MAKQQGMAPAEQFIERLGLLIEADGFPRIAGRILGFMLITSGPCRGADLAAQLQISHGSVSTNTRLLERFGILERVAFPGDRSDYFQLADDPFGKLIDGALERARRMYATVHESRKALADQPPDARRRLIAMERFYKLWITSIEDVKERWATKDSSASV